MSTATTAAAPYHVESFTPDEEAILRRHVTNLTLPVFALTGLPEVTCAALFARYSRSSKSLRRLLLDEFITGDDAAAPASQAVGAGRASDLFSRVLSDYGDDSVAQLAGVHIACEQVSQPLAKAIEWGRLMAYLEQSTRYIPYTDKRDGEYRYHRDPAVMASPLRDVYRGAMDGLFDTYVGLLTPLQEHLDRTLPPEPDEQARRRAIRALALDQLRGLLPAGTVSNIGVFGSPQAFEQMVLRLRAHPLPEARAYAELIADELRRVIPDFVTRLDRAERGGVWVDYLRETAEQLAAEARALAPAPSMPEPARVSLVEWDRDAEDQILAAALYPHALCSERELLDAVRALPAVDRERVFAAAVGERGNRRHKPGRGFEHAAYTFEVVSDYGAFRDLQRHRMLTIQWQRLTPDLGYTVPADVDAAGLGDRWRAAVERAEDAHGQLLVEYPEQAAYTITLGHRMRYLMRFNAREAMHMIELRTSPQAHPSYRRICQEMHRLIADEAKHPLIAGSLRFVGSADVHLPRYASEAKRGDRV